MAEIYTKPLHPQEENKDPEAYGTKLGHIRYKGIVEYDAMERKWDKRKRW